MSKSRVVLVLLILVAALVGWRWWSYQHPIITNSNPKGTNIIILGDSLSAGTGVTADTCYVSLLEKQLGVRILNMSVPGDTTDQGLARLQADVLVRDPKVVLIQLGGNDLLQRMPREQTLRNIETMIGQIQNTGAAVVLLGVDSPMSLGRLAPAFRELAKKYRTGCVPNVLSGLMGHPTLMVDEVHPNADGHKIMSARIAKELRRALPKVFSKAS